MHGVLCFLTCFRVAQNCQNKPEFEDKRKQAIERIQERNGTAFAKGRKPCNCKVGPVTHHHAMRCDAMLTRVSRVCAAQHVPQEVLRLLPGRSRL